MIPRICIADDRGHRQVLVWGLADLAAPGVLLAIAVFVIITRATASSLYLKNEAYLVYARAAAMSPSFIAPADDSLWRRFAFPIGLSSLAALAVVLSVFFLMPPNVRARRRTAGTCGCCNYSLSGSKRAGDGCLECPECGAAWKAAAENIEEAQHV